MSHDLPRPIVNADSQPYWDGARESKLLIRKCKACSAFHFMPRHVCPDCWSTDLEWVESAGKGSVHSFSIIRRASLDAYSARTPYVTALIDLDEGPRMVTNIVGDDALSVAIGDRVTVVFEDRGDGALLPQFQRAAAGA
ncbi:MAG TPA: Zn-ribbon domain-containing OB-fold protein [Burkholderiaceae bacterium]|nr:Zn-ribbon domain-containing OB-fold protein [Burkholderiaceae bacterium]